MDPNSLSNSELIDQVRTWAARVARGVAELLALIGELDVRDAWAGHGVTSCAHWLSWQLGWSDTTAREHVRVAGALRALPLFRAELAAGRLSYSQVRAVTRIATAVEDEPRWLELARCCTGAQLDKIASGAARAKAADTPGHERPVKRAAQAEWDDDGDLVLTLRIPAHEAVPVLAVLEQYKSTVQAERDETLRELLAEALPGPASASAEAPPASAPAKLLAAEDAKGYDPLQPFPRLEPDYPIGPDRIGLRLTDAEQAALHTWEGMRSQWRDVRDAWNERREQLLLQASARRVPTGTATLADALVRALTRPTDGPKTTVRLLVDPLSGWARTQHDDLLPRATLDALVRQLPTRADRSLRSNEAAVDLSGYDQDRASRVVSPALRRLLGQVDGERCRFPGCRHTRYLHAHHLVFWRDGGPTDLSNMILFCTKHHRLLHNLGYVLHLEPNRTLHVTSPDGTRLEHYPALPDASAEALPPATPDTLAPGYKGDRLDLGYTVNVMLAHAA